MSTVEFFARFGIQQSSADHCQTREHIRYNRQPSSPVAVEVCEDLHGPHGSCGGELAVFNIDGMLVPAYRLRNGRGGFNNWCTHLKFKAIPA